MVCRQTGIQTGMQDNTVIIIIKIMPCSAGFQDINYNSRVEITCKCEQHMSLTVKTEFQVFYH